MYSSNKFIVPVNYSQLACSNQRQIYYVNSMDASSKKKLDWIYDFNMHVCVSLNIFVRFLFIVYLSSVICMELSWICFFFNFFFLLSYHLHVICVQSNWNCFYRVEMSVCWKIENIGIIHIAHIDKMKSEKLHENSLFFCTYSIWWKKIGSIQIDYAMLHGPFNSKISVVFSIYSTASNPSVSI